MTNLRTRRDPNSNQQRCYVGDALIGSIVKMRIPTRGRQHATRWRAVPAAYAYTLGCAPADLLLPARATESLPDFYVSRTAALRGLVDHLRHHGARAVSPLYGEHRGL